LRIKIVQKPKAICIDGLQLDQFVVGGEYEVSWRFGALMLMEGWAEPVTIDPEEPRERTNTEPQIKAADKRPRRTRRQKR
jgi:hypothetical protein